MNHSKKSYAFTIEDFFLGRLYPLILCLLVLTAQIFSLEHIIIPLIVVIACISLLCCRTIKPIITPLCAFLYTLSRDNAVFGPESSDYYFTGWRLAAIFVLAAFVIFAFARFFIKTSFIRRMRERGTPGIIPLLLLSAAFLLNGAGTEHWQFKNIIFALGQIVVYLIVFILFYHGLSEDEDTKDVGDYFAYICALISVVIAAELAAVYITNDVLVDGVILRYNILFGWGACNTLGIITLLIPLNFYSAYRSRKHSCLYLITATLAYLTAIFSISRNALLIGTVIYILSLALFCLFGDKKRIFRIYALIVLLLTAAVLIIFREQIATAFQSYLDRGFTDNGRFEIWRRAWEHFLINPIFGNGFNAPVLYDAPMVSFIPMMAHNTILQVLFSMGIVGIICYGIYILSTIVPFLKRPDMMKFAYALLCLALFGIGMLDNFAFHIQPVFFYSIAMAIVQRAANEKDYFI